MLSETTRRRAPSVHLPLAKCFLASASAGVAGGEPQWGEPSPGADVAGVHPPRARSPGETLYGQSARNDDRMPNIDAWMAAASSLSASQAAASARAAMGVAGSTHRQRGNSVCSDVGAQRLQPNMSAQARKETKQTNEHDAPVAAEVDRWRSHAVPRRHMR